MKNRVMLFIIVILSTTNIVNAKSNWVPLSNGKDLNDWFVRGKATWSM